ncbi:uncharacterized protein LOC116416531 [Nasonia vitripennis]|uniref:Integrase core domain-containing protein n=1 Tax=Nasonia vitripennis TaxID=7425 RepID=A0A7M7Q3Z5_NASVI|nr:uncharacterized protein LOC116416531 [Nasonia vitripennis]
MVVVAAWVIKTLWRRLQQFYGLSVYRYTVLEPLHVLDPEGFNDRLRHRLKRRVYHVPGPNFLWHIDRYDKLKPYGFAIHGGIDGFSRKILWLEVASTNNKPEVIAYYYLKTLQRMNLIPTLMRSDHGTENCWVESLHQALRHKHEDQLTGPRSFIKGKRTSNQRIEAYWSQMRRQGVHFWINLFKDLIDADLFHDSDPVHVELLRYCFGPLLAYDLEMIKIEWNRQRIRKQKCRDLVPGKPNCLYYNPEMYGRRDYKKSVDQHEIITYLQEFTIKPHLFQSLTEELVKLLKEDVTVPTSIEAALYLFVELTTLTDEYQQENN